VTQPEFFVAQNIWCPKCRGVVMTRWSTVANDQGRTWPCACCDGPTTVQDTAWLTLASARMRDAIRKDVDLLPALKAEWEEVHDAAPFPRLEPPLDWFNEAWERAGRRRGRPASVLKRYELAHAVDWLERAHVSKRAIEELVAADSKKRPTLYNRLPESVRRLLGSDGQGNVIAAPRAGPRTLWASVQWARRQWTNPSVRGRREGPFPNAVQQKTKSRATAEPGDLLSSDFLSTIPTSCLKCRSSGGLDQFREGDLTCLRCRLCGWNGRVRQTP